MRPWGVAGSSAMVHDPSACRTQTWTYYALDISLVGRRFSYLFCELLDVQLGPGPDLGTVPGHCLPPTPGTGLSPAEERGCSPGSCGWKLSLEGAVPSCPQQCEWVRCLELRGQGWARPVCADPAACMPPAPGAGRQAQRAVCRGRCPDPPPPSLPLTGAAPSPQSPRASSAAGAVLVWLGARKGPPASTASRNRRGEGRKRELDVKVTPLASPP